MGSIIDSAASFPFIPVVDFSQWRSKPTDRQQIARSLIEAFQSVGFVYITNHGLPPHLISEAFSMSQRLFALTEPEKQQAPHPPTPDWHRGYSSPGLEKVSQYMDGDTSVGESLRAVTDYKESYEIGSENNTHQPNIWLPEETLPGFRDCMQRFYWECHALAREILECVALGLGLDGAEHLLRFHTGYNNQLRLLHYPPVPAKEMEEGRVARISAHSDWSTLTMLFQDDCGGLEVEDPACEGRFMAATPVEGACVVNVGDLLMRWSNDKLKSTSHRVTLPPLSDRYSGAERLTRARYSIPYFVSPHPDALVECLPGCSDGQHLAKYAPITQDEYGKMRAKVQYRTSEAS